MVRLLRISSCRMITQSFNQRFFCSLPALPPLQLPSPKEAHIWYVRPDEVKSKELLNNYMEILSPCEKKIVSQVQGEESKKRSLLARALVRTTIARYQINSSISPRSLKFTKNRYGKPEVDWRDTGHWNPPDQPPLHFNLSHTSSLVACGVTTDSPIGIDVEEKHRTTKHNILSLARRYFSDHEVQFLSAIPDPQVQHQEFIKLWTLKEAYVKALGSGFSGTPFKTFTIRVVPEAGESSSETPEIVMASADSAELAGNWRFELLELASSHYIALCTKNAQGDRRFPLKVMVRKTIPFLDDQFVCGEDTVVTIGGLTKLL